MQLTKDILQKIRSIEIHTKRLLSGTLIGDYNSQKKGSGLEFNQIRDYQEGDDVRFIDWNSSARQNKLLIKEYVEDRSRAFMIVIDISTSTNTGSLAELKHERYAQIASVLALVGNYAKDHVGLILFSDQIHTIVPPKMGRKHVRMIIDLIFSKKTTGKTNINLVCKKLLDLKRKDAIVFLISDFYDSESYKKSLRMVSQKYETIAIRSLDAVELKLPACGVIPLQDPETGETCFIRSDSKNLQELIFARNQEIAWTIQKSGADFFDMPISKPFMGELVRFCRQRFFT